MKKINKCVATVLLLEFFSHVSSNTYSPATGPQLNLFNPQESKLKPKQTIQQFQVAVVLPPGSQAVQGNQPPNQASPDYVWLQIPSSLLNSQSTQKPPAPILVPANPPSVPGVQQPLFTVTQPTPDVLSKKCLKPRGQFPSDACNKYVNCWDGVGVEQFCPEGLVFNSKGYCDYSYNVNCGKKPIQGIPSPPTSNDTSTISPIQITQAPTTAPPPTVIVSLPTIDPNLRKKCLQPRGQFRSEDCNKYVNCWDDVVIEQECPEGLLFSSKGYCDYPENVDCKNVTIPPKISNDFDDECPIEFGTFREKANCSNYFTCIGGKVVAKYSCPSGFSFNDNIGVCDYAERVDCSKEPLIFNPKSNFLANIPKDFMKKIDHCQPGTVFALNPQCTAACICRGGLSEVVQCPMGLAYDSKTDKCMLPRIAKC